LSIRRHPGCEDLPLPRYMTPGAAGLDLPAAVDEPLTIEPGRLASVPTGMSVAIPPGYEGQVRPRSGLALRHQMTVLNSPGTIDSDYRGPVQVLLANLGPEPFTVRRGDRIAQLIIAPVVQAEVVEVADMDATERGEGGMGSTGRN